MKLAINYIEFASPNIGASRAFFEKAFGWSFTDYGPAYIGFNEAGIDGGIAAAEAPAAPPLVILYADDLDAADRKSVV